MRVPLPVAAALSAVVVAVVWWIGTRHLDFLKNQNVPAPAEAGTLAGVPADDALQGLPAAAPDQGSEVASRPAIEPVVEPVPEPVAEELLPDFGDLAASPALDTYASLAARGPALLARFAEALEAEGHPQHALLAWERVLDHTSPPPEVRASADAAVVRLRPTLPPWQVDPTGRTRLFLRVEAHASLREVLAPVVAEAAETLAEASSGLLEIAPELIAPKARLVAGHAVAVAVSIHAPAPGSSATPVMVFTAADPSPAALRAGLARSLYRLTRDRLLRLQRLSPLPEPGPDADHVTMLRFGPTRLAWECFAASFTGA